MIVITFTALIDTPKIAQEFTIGDKIDIKNELIEALKNMGVAPKKTDIILQNSTGKYW